MADRPVIPDAETVMTTPTQTTEQRMREIERRVHKIRTFLVPYGGPLHRLLWHDLPWLLAQVRQQRKENMPNG